ncbi:MAG: glycosyltransferase [Candidatus Diapherotrites archaeon]|uniref:Glycosyltransferase n=1 Tax=Candidatus Iainarchaeum sp. TaxID=3101447 RepID=A0A8T4C5K1_9ARCH|nr:glycosyltransferase [Candidatus Diapherotrites archaeon]
MKKKLGNAVLFNLSNRSIPGGTESFARVLGKIVPDLRVVGREDVLSDGLRFPQTMLNDVAVAKAQAEWLENQSVKPSFLFTSGLHGWAVPSTLTNIPTIGVLHGSFFRLADVAYPAWHPLYWRMKLVYSHFEKKSLANAHVRVSNSPLTQKNNEIDYQLDSRVVELPIDTTIFSPGSKTIARKKIGFADSKKIVLFVGNPTYSKGWDIVQMLAREFPEVAFMCICYPAPLSTDKNMIIIPSVPHEKLVNYYRSADVLVFPSRYEGFGFVLLEALASNCPVISSRVGIVNNFTGEGLHVIPHHPDAFVVKLREVLKSNSGANTHRVIRERFSFNHFSRGIREAMNDAAQRAGDYE